MSVGIVVPLPAYTLDPAFTAKKAEDVGFEPIWYHEHPILPVESASPFPATGGAIPWTYRHFSEPYIALAMAAAVTRTIKLATGITLVTERNPLLLAKEIAVLDLHSHGRFLFGVGTGWNREETTVMGGDFDSGARLRMAHPLRDRTRNGRAISADGGRAGPVARSLARPYKEVRRCRVTCTLPHKTRTRSWC